MRRLPLVLGLTLACRGADKGSTIDTGTVATGSTALDADGDGYVGDEDCNDSDASVNPGALEQCDGIDNNCDGDIDEGATTTFYADADNDGFGDPAATTEACGQPAGHVAAGTDCDDNDDQSFPGAPERCDGADNDCDDEIDEDLAEIWYADTDGDGFGDADARTDDCDPDDGWVADATDCDDTNASAYPEAEEACDETDNDCDGETDEGVTQTWYTDADGDGAGSDETIEACTEPSGASEEGGDCDDTDRTVSPWASELCDEIDNDCDGAIDESDAADASDWYADGDGDGYGDADTAQSACDQPSGHVADSSDCDDDDDSVNPNAVETCNDTDDDCDGDIDEDATDATTWYADADGDGYGDADTVEVSCDAASGWLDDATDCDDTDAAINPGAEEVCDGADNDCDSTTDENATDAATWYEDSDGDGFGADATVACDQPTGHVEDDGDCDDGDDDTNPNAAETCDGADNDCDGATDEDDATDASTWYIDADGDGFGVADTTQSACAAPSGYAAEQGDCDDTLSDVNPNAAEVCDEQDNDCDGTVDESDAADASDWYADDDGDGYGDADTAQSACDQPTGYLADSSDCDDTSAWSNPGASELHDTQDNDCDGDTDEDLHLGTGADGALSVTTDLDLSTQISGARTDADAVTYAVLAFGGTDSVVADQTVTGLDPGDEVLILNLQGSESAYASVGAWELASVDAVSGNQITTMADLTAVWGETDNTDLTDQVVVVMRVPHYTDVDISGGATLTTAGWDGASGGVLAFRATGVVTIEDGSSVSVDALGYAGGATGSTDNCDGFQGESTIGLGDGDGDGDGVCTAYNEDYGHWASNAGGGGAHITGGGGEYGGGATPGDSWTGEDATAPEAGVEYGDAELSAIFLGSGGGGVWNGGTDNEGENPGPGGAGGGVLLVGAGELIAEGAGAIRSAGESPEHWSYGSWTYGAGAGAGGSIWLIADSLELAADAIDATGGLGVSDVERVGGDGGVGRVRLEFDTCNGYAIGDAGADTAVSDAADPDPGHTAAP